MPRRIMTGVAAALALLLLTAGVPLWLIAVAGNPLPANPAALPAMLLRPDTGGRLLMGTVLPIIAWIAWGYFACALALELIDRFRGRTRAARGLMLPGRAAAAALVGAVAALSLSAAAPEQALSAHSPAEASAGTIATAPSGAAPRAAQHPPPRPVITVRSGDTLWMLAERHLGSGERFGEIAEANMGVPQPDGGALGADLWLMPGWRLVLPSDAVQAASEDVRIEAGDTLWEIAEQHLGDGERYPEIAAASGIGNPDELAVGQPVELPGTDPPREATPPSVTATPPSTAELLATQDDAAGEAGAPAAETIRVELDTRTAGGLSAIVAAGIVGWIGLRRRAQRRSRRPGQRIALPTAPAQAFERELRAVAAQAQLDRLTGILRRVADAGLETAGRVPALCAIRIDGDEHTLYFTEPTRLPRPFSPIAEDGSAWSLTGPLPAPVEEALGSQNPYPALTCLGEDARGGQLLVDLEQLRVLGVEGDPEEAEAVLAATALELATSPWGGASTVTVLGGTAMTAELLGTDRIRHLSDAHSLIRELRGRTRSTRHALSSLGFADLLHARASDDAEAWAPEIVLACPGADPAAREEIAGIAEEGGCGIAVFGPQLPTAAWTLRLDGNGLAHLLMPDGAGSIELHLQRLDPREQLNLERIVSAGFTPEQPGPAWSHRLPEEARPDEHADANVPGEAGVPGETDFFEELSPTAGSAPEAERRRRPRSADPLDAEARALVDRLNENPWVRLLGPVSLHNAAGQPPRAPQGGPVNRGAMNRATELIAFLALHPGASAVQVHAAFWPGRQAHGKTAAASRNGLVSRTRRWLGHAPDGSMYFPHVGSDGYLLHESVTTDWQIFQLLIAEDITKTSTARLRAAADLVRGEPLSGVKDRYYVWAEVLRMDMLAGIGDVCHELVRRSLREGDIPGARAAAALARQVDPVSETAWRDALRAELRAGDAAGFERIESQLTALLNELDPEEEPDAQTQRLIAEARRTFADGAA